MKSRIKDNRVYGPLLLITNGAPCYARPEHEVDLGVDDFCCRICGHDVHPIAVKRTIKRVEMYGNKVDAIIEATRAKPGLLKRFWQEITEMLRMEDMS